MRMTTTEIPESKVCALDGCGTEFHRESRSKSNWAKMRYCSPVCANQARANTLKDSAADGREDTKICQLTTCGQEFKKTASVSWNAFEKRQYCGRACALAAGQLRHATKEVPPKECGNPTCGNEMIFDINSDNILAFLKRMYCSDVCRAEGKRAKAKTRVRDRTQRPVRTRLAPPSPVMHIPDAPPSEPKPVWRPIGFAPRPHIPPHIREWNEQNQQEQKAS